MTRNTPISLEILKKSSGRVFEAGGSVQERRRRGSVDELGAAHARAMLNWQYQHPPTGWLDAKNHQELAATNRGVAQ